MRESKELIERLEKELDELEIYIVKSIAKTANTCPWCFKTLALVMAKLIRVKELIRLILEDETK